MTRLLKEVSRAVCFSACLRVAAAVCFCAPLLIAQPGDIVAKDERAKETLDRAFKALGGKDKIDEIKALIIRGTETIIPNEGQIVLTGPTKFEYKILLPDSFLNINISIPNANPNGISRGKLVPPYYTDEVFAQMAASSTTERAETVKKNMAIRESEIVKERTKQWLRFLIGTIMKPGATKLIISSGSNSGAFTLTEEDGTAEEIEFDSKTGYPSVIRYKNEPKPVFGTLTISDGKIRVDTINDKASVKPVDCWIRFENRFSVNGFMIPGVITTKNSDTHLNELRIEEVLINPSLNLKDFEIKY